MKESICNLAEEISNTGFRYRDNGDGTFDVCYDHREDSFFDMSAQSTAVVSENTSCWLVDYNTGAGIAEYPKEDWSLKDAITDQNEE